jgi:hypothetical protein
MDLFDLNPDDRQTLANVCQQEGIDESYASFVARHLDAPDSTWRWCCGSHCDPCVSTLARAVDRARRTLCIAPQGLPDDDPAS